VAPQKGVATVTTIDIQIGGDRVVFVVAATTAPKSYDGFGTFTLAEIGTEDNPQRLVLIREEHLQWQTTRYGSDGATEAGWFDWFHPEHIDVAPVLWKRLAGIHD
jgi:hypothetical protein